MHASTLLILSPLLAGILALPQKRQTPSADDVTAAINAWLNDVVIVNTFLNNPTDPSLATVSLETNTIQTAAGFTENIANDEPVQLGILSSLPGLSDNALRSINNLQGVFGNVPSALENIVENGHDATRVAIDIQLINLTRCCNVLPDLDILWTEAARVSGATFTVPSVPRPQACLDGSIDCSGD